MNKPSPQPNQVLELLRSHGVTPTTQRLSIARTIFSKPQHFSADQLLAETNKSGKQVSKATVYNTLELFARKGLVRQLVVDPSRVYYDSSRHPHFHFYNPDTQELTDLDPSEVEVKLPANLPAGTQLENVDLIIHVRPST